VKQCFVALAVANFELEFESAVEHSGLVFVVRECFALADFVVAFFAVELVSEKRSELSALAHFSDCSEQRSGVTFAQCSECSVGSSETAGRNCSSFGRGLAVVDCQDSANSRFEWSGNEFESE